MRKKVLIILVVAGLLIAGLIAYFMLPCGEPKPLRQVLRELAEEIKEKRELGYDVIEAEYYALSAAYYYRLGDLEKAEELALKARELLERAEPLPSLPGREWRVAESNVEIDRAPTTWDFVPVGAVFVKTKGGYLAYPGNDDKWKLSCFIMLAMGKTEDGRVFVYQGRLPLMPEESSFKPKVYVGGRWITPSIVFLGPLYFDEGEKFGLPTVYQYDLSGRYLQTLSYDEENRMWIHTIEKVESGEKILEIKAKARGVPMWLGEWNGSFIIHGVYARTKDFDLWGGFWDVCEMEAVLRYGGEALKIKGVFIFDRASHRAYYGEEKPRGSPLSFTCMVIYQEDLAIMVAHSQNPSPIDAEVSFQHQLRINIYSLNLSIATRDFEIRDDGSIQPSTFTLTGRFDGGYFNLTGRVLLYWPEKWVEGRGTWWNPKNCYTWGRAFTVWTGVVVVGDKVINVDAWGAGEYTRFGECKTTTGCEVDHGCWRE